MNHFKYSDFWIDKTSILVDLDISQISNDILIYFQKDIDRVFIVSDDNKFLQITNRLYSSEDGYEIHEKIRKSLIADRRVKTLVILDGISSNRYLLDLMQNRSEFNHLTIIVRTVQISDLIKNIAKNIVVPVTAGNEILSYVYDKVFHNYCKRELFDDYFISYSSGYLCFTLESPSRYNVRNIPFELFENNYRIENRDDYDEKNLNSLEISSDLYNEIKDVIGRLQRIQDRLKIHRM